MLERKDDLQIQIVFTASNENYEKAILEIQKLGGFTFLTSNKFEIKQKGKKTTMAAGVVRFQDVKSMNKAYSYFKKTNCNGLIIICHKFSKK